MHLPSSERLRATLTEWFPLLPRPRPTCRALPERVSEIAGLAREAAHGAADKRLATAAEAHNKGALVLSDCGLADDAHQLCWRQFGLFHDHRPLAPATAKLSLQPLVNLGRLHIRGGQAARAHRLFTNAFDTVQAATPTAIDGQDIDLNELIDDDAAARGELVRFLWTVLLADGTRALTRSGQWTQALVHIKRHRGIGDRMLDGRQVAILASLVNGDHDQALTLLEHSYTPEPWERAVASCLTTLCLANAGRDPHPAATTMVEHYLELAHDRVPPVFGCRLGLCVLDLADHASQASIATEITRQAITSADAYAAQDVLTHPTCAQVASAAEREALVATISAAGLQHGPETPPGVLTELRQAVAAAESCLTHELARASPTPSTGDVARSRRSER